MFLLYGCAEDAVISIDHKSQLVIQSRISPDTSFLVHVGTSLAVTDPAEFRVPDDVSVDIVDITDPLIGIRVPFYQENGAFVAPQHKPQAGHSYKIFVSAPGFPIAEAVTLIPDPVQLSVLAIRELKVVPSEASIDKKNVSYKLYLEFEPHNHRYFHLNFFQTTSINHGSAAEPDIRLYVYDMNPQFPDEDGYYQHHETGVLVDALMTHGMSHLEFSFVDYTLADVEILGNLYLEVRTVTEDYYQYFTSLSRQLISREDPFAEPISVYNNIHEGYGNFSGYSRRLYAIAVIP